MSEEIALARADSAALADLHARCQLLELRAADALRRAEQAEADAASWIAFVGEAARQLEQGAKCEEIQSDLFEAYHRAREGNAPGAALLAKLHAAEDAYERLLGAFDLHMDILDCQQALADYAGIFYDVALGALAARAAGGMEREGLL